MKNVKLTEDTLKRDSKLIINPKKTDKVMGYYSLNAFIKPIVRKTTASEFFELPKLLNKR